MGRPLQGEWRSCIRCKKSIRVSPSAIKRGKGKYCSRECSNFGKSIAINCNVCSKRFTSLITRINEGRGKFCSRKCYEQDWNKRIPGWNKGKPSPWTIGNKYRLGTTNPNSYFIINKQIEDKNVNWKGDDVGYRALHYWVERNLGKDSRCDHCGTTDPNIRYHWANKSHNYLRDKNDWLRLCLKCHRRYDSKNAI